MANETTKQFLNTGKQFARDLINEPTRIQQNRSQRQAIFDRESKSDVLTSRQLEQLKNIANADDAQRFVEAAQLGGANGGQKEYEEIMQSQREALISFGTDVAELAVGGAAVKGGVKIAGSVFKGAAEALGSKIPSLGKISDVFKSEATMAREAQEAKEAARAEAKAQRQAESQRQAQEDIQRSRAEQGKQTTPFRPQQPAAQKPVETLEEAPNPPKKGIIRRAAEATGKGVVKGASWTAGQVLKQAKDLSGAAWKGATKLGLPAGALIAAGNEWLPDDVKQSVSETAQEGVDWAFGEGGEKALDSAGKKIKEFIENPKETLNSAMDSGKEALEKGKEAAEEYGPEVLGGIVGAGVGSGQNPFRGVSLGGIGSLFPSNNSTSAALTSMPSGGDSGSVGEGHFGIEDLSGKSTSEILSKIYGIMVKVHDSIQKISNDTSAIVRSFSQQDSSRDLAASNLRARQNEGGGMASAIIESSGSGGGGESSSGEEKPTKNKKEKGGFWSGILSKGKDVVKGASKVGGAVVKGIANAAKPLVVPALVTGAVIAEKAGKPHKDFQEHYNKVYTMALQEAKERGLENPEAVAHMAASQSTEETGGGHHKPTQNALFGIKYSKKGQGTSDPSDLVSTPEEFNGKTEKIKDRFRGYKSEQDSVKDFFDFTSTNKYKKTRTAKTPEEAISAIGESGYATSSKYGHNVMKHYLTYGKAHDDKQENKEEIKEAKIQNQNTGEPKKSTSVEIKGGETETVTVTGGESHTRYAEKVEQTPEEKAYEAYENDPLHNPPPAKVAKGVSKYWKEKHPEIYGPADNQKDAELEKKREDVYKNRNQLTNDELNKQYDEINREQNNNEWAKINGEEPQKPTATPINPMISEVDSIDKRKSELDEELTQQSLHTVYSDKESMDKDLKRLDEIYAETNSLNERRNNITGTPEYLDAIHKQNNPQPQQQASNQQSAPPPKPSSNSGGSKKVPPVRNDDPTLKMMEEGNMWRTTSSIA